MIVITTCGAKKSEFACKAMDMYIGPYAKTCLKYAQHLTDESNIYILSAKYGILNVNDIIEPYSVTFGDRQSIKVAEIISQANNMNIMNHQIIVLGGKRYVNIVREIWKNVQSPLSNKGGIGKQIQWMLHQIKNQN